MMNKIEMGEIVAMCSALDGQIVSESKVAMWLETLGHYSYEECREAIVPACKESSSGIVTAKGIWEQVRRKRSQPVPRQWVKDLHDIGEHFECRGGEFGHPMEVSA
jgi:hypothetical protein